MFKPVRKKRTGRFIKIYIAGKRNDGGVVPYGEETFRLVGDHAGSTLRGRGGENERPRCVFYGGFPAYIYIL